MALQSIKGVVAWPGTSIMGMTAFNGSTGALTNNAVSGAGQKVAFVFACPTPGGNLTVTDVVFYASNATSAGDCDVRLETVGADGNPTGTLAGTNTNVVFNIASTGVKTATLTASASLTAGTLYAVVFTYSTGTWGIGTFTAGDSRGMILGAGVGYVRTHNGSAWSANTANLAANPVMALKLNGGSFALIPGLSPVSAFNKTTFNNTTSVRKRGSAFIPRFTGTVCGWEMYGGGIAAADFTVELRSTAGTLLATWSHDKDWGNYYGPGTGYASFIRGYFAATYDVTAGTTYDLLVVPGSATNIQVTTASIILTGDTNSIQALPGQSDNIQVEIDSGSVRTTDNTKWPLMNLLFSKLDDGAGGTPASGGLLGGDRTMYQQINKGVANPTVRVLVVDNPAGTPETSVSAASSGLALWYERERGGRATFTAYNLANTSASWTAGGMAHISDGYYRVDLPDAAVTTGANTVLCGISGLTSMVAYATLVDLADPISVSAGGVKVSGFTADAFDSSAIASSAVTKIQAGLALATSLSAVSTQVSNLAASVSGNATLLTTINNKTSSLSFASGNVLSRMVSGAADAIDSSVVAASAVTKIQAGLAEATSLSAVETKINAIQAKTSSLSFASGRALIDLRAINGTVINGDGSGTPFGP